MRVLRQLGEHRHPVPPRHPDVQEHQVEVAFPSSLQPGRAVVSDLDLDGCPDVYVANDFQENDFLYHNNCNGTFTESIARATGHTYTATRVNANIKRQVAAIVRSVPRPTTPLTVYHELDQHFYSATSHTFIGQMYKLLGLQNIADKAGGSSDYPQLSAEYVIASNPDLITSARL